MKILVIDDDQFTLDSISFYLKSEGFEILKALDSYKALEILEKVKVDLIICDILLPSLSGLGLLSLLKNFYLEKTPVILISSLDQKEVVSSSMSLGAQDFIIKPINFEELLSKIKRLTSIPVG